MSSTKTCTCHAYMYVTVFLLNLTVSSHRVLILKDYQEVHVNVTVKHLYTDDKFNLFICYLEHV